MLPLSEQSAETYLIHSAHFTRPTKGVPSKFSDESEKSDSQLFLTLELKNRVCGFGPALTKAQQTNLK